MSSSTRLIPRSEMLLICFLTVAECPSYTAVHRQWSGLPCCCCPYLEKSAPTLSHRHPLSVLCFPRCRLKAFRFKRSFLHVSFTASFLVTAQWQLSFRTLTGKLPPGLSVNRTYLLTYLHTYLLQHCFLSKKSAFCNFRQNYCFRFTVNQNENNALIVVIIWYYLLYMTIITRWKAVW